ncbi:hypothetical protein ElyMa_002105600, partial [Elysia marginata]
MRLPQELQVEVPSQGLNAVKDAHQIIGQFCGREAVALGKKYFGVEFYGECYFGDDKDLDY